jgi:hypothetical protein
MSEPRLSPADVSQREKQMNTTYKFAPVPSNSTVAGGVTILVSAWFLVAAGAIFADPAAGPAQRAALTQRESPTEIAIAPEARLRITVEAPRLKS